LKLKAGSVSLDTIDVRILQALKENSRQTYKEIGQSLGVAHSTVYDRMKRMKEQGIIKNYTIDIDTDKAGIKSIIAVITIYTDPKESEAVAQQLSEVPEVLEVYTSLSEELLIIVKAIEPNQENLHAFIANSVAPLPGVLRIRTSIVTKKFKETSPSIINESRSERL
jgi:Lrp/AsnC family transcriptional regulator for asnA, asnC and gidA